MSNLPRDTGPAKLPGLPAVNQANLLQVVQALVERAEVREGARGNPYERAVTVRELVAGGFTGLAGFPNSNRGAVGNVLTVNSDGTYSSITPDAFAESIRKSKLYADLMKRLDDATRFDGLPEQVKAVLLADLAAEAAKRGAEIQRLEYKLQTATDSLAYTVQEVTAAVDGSVAGVRQTVFASATESRATAGTVTQLVANLDGTGSATIEDSLVVIADRTDGLRAQKMLKLSAGNAVAGYGLMASEDPGGITSSAFIVEAGQFSLTSPYNFSQSTTPSAASAGQTWYNTATKLSYRSTASGTGSWTLYTPVIPFGVDTATGSAYINGSLRIGYGGTPLSSITAGLDGQAVLATATGQVFAIDNAGTATPSSITISLVRPSAINGTEVNGSFVWTVISGTFTGSLSTVNSSTGAIASFAPSAMSTDSVTFRCTYTVATSGSLYLGKVYTDDVTVVKVRQGVGVSVFLTNESHSVPASSAGVVSSFSGAGGTFKVYSGTTDVTTSCTFSIPTNTDALTASIGASTGVYSATAAGSWNNASNLTTITLRATYVHPVTGSANYDKVFTITKSLGGVVGVRGTLTGSRASVGAAWSDTVANAVILDLQNGSPAGTTTTTASTTHLRVGDSVTESFSGAPYSESKYWSGASWITAALVVNGNAIVSGTIGAGALVATAIDGMTVTGATVRTAASGARWVLEGSSFAQVIRGYNAGGSESMRLDSTEGFITISGQSGATTGSTIATVNPSALTCSSLTGYGLVLAGNGTRAPLALGSLTASPSSANNGDLYCNNSGTVANRGLYAYVSGAWVNISKTQATRSGGNNISFEWSSPNFSVYVDGSVIGTFNSTTKVWS